jgi:hypothetical protein
MYDVSTQVKDAGLNTGLRTKVLIEVNEDYHDAQAVSQTLHSGMIEQLVHCFKDENPVIRELASRGIMQVAQVNKGREYIVRYKIVVDVAKLFEDDEI